ncbi:hypothetical protein CONPUDRAFT_166432 [Coniophora puteana RWD-64-598 SS2]|uniref:BTB domain-containing protein n=1 Tax=Coniophora puteana (strain RWD-64-598) TaxID=741705 RepID=A0A5M3MKG4_CONPW|nr:uncharacterized protein CONPUDRAFT_166432 [Coniophora puteana RWD-64-598 SS2]EIW79712.1 hypothetical protein CONPUDRAFT_166432 [Coniophora puteana RWD-64-598 SS2]
MAVHTVALSEVSNLSLSPPLSPAVVPVQTIPGGPPLSVLDMFWPFQTSAPRTYGSPGITIRTSDGRVMSFPDPTYLFGSAPFFSDMLSSATDGWVDVTLTENQHDFLRFVYLARAPQLFAEHYIDKTAELCFFADSAKEYKVPGAIQALSDMLTSPRFLEKNAFRAYCIACRYGWEQVARKAARHTFHFGPLVTPGIAQPEDLALISGVSYHSLLLYHEACRATTREISSHDLSNCAKYEVQKFPRCSKCGGRRIYQTQNMTLPAWLTGLLIDVSLEVEGIPPDAPVSKPQHVKNALQTAARCSMCSKKVFSVTVERMIDAFFSQLQRELSAVMLAFE